MRASGICNTVGRAATIITPFVVVRLFKSYEVRGVLGFMMGLLIVEIVVVVLFGIEPRKRRLEEIDQETPAAHETAKA
jgi:putative MFS transporter